MWRVASGKRGKVLLFFTLHSCLSICHSSLLLYHQRSFYCVHDVGHREAVFQQCGHCSQVLPDVEKKTSCTLRRDNGAPVHRRSFLQNDAWGNLPCRRTALRTPCTSGARLSLSSRRILTVLISRPSVRDCQWKYFRACTPDRRSGHRHRHRRCAQPRPTVRIVLHEYTLAMGYRSRH